MTTLKNVLRINAVSSGATGIMLVLFAGFIAELFAVSVKGAFIEVGIFLVIFASFVFFQSTKSAISVKGVSFIIILDCIWVVASVVIVFFQLFSLSVTGYLLIAAVAVWVAVMAILQMKGLKQLNA